MILFSTLPETAIFLVAATWFINSSAIDDLSSLQTVNGEAHFVCKYLFDLPSLQSFKSMKASENIINKLKNNFIRVDGMTVRKR